MWCHVSHVAPLRSFHQFSLHSYTNSNWGCIECIGVTHVSNETWNASLFLAVRVGPIIFKGRRTQVRRCPLIEKSHNNKDGLMDVVSLYLSTKSYRHCWQRSPGPNSGCDWFWARSGSQKTVQAAQKANHPRHSDQLKFSHQRRPNPYRSIVALVAALQPGAISHTATLLQSSWGFPLRILCLWLNYDTSLQFTCLNWGYIMLGQLSSLTIILVRSQWGRDTLSKHNVEVDTTSFHRVNSMSPLPLVHQLFGPKCEHKPQRVGNWNIPVAEKDASLRLSCMGYLGIKYLAKMRGNSWHGGKYGLQNHTQKNRLVAGPRSAQCAVAGPKKWSLQWLQDPARIQKWASKISLYPSLHCLLFNLQIWGCSQFSTTLCIAIHEPRCCPRSPNPGRTSSAHPRPCSWFHVLYRRIYQRNTTHPLSNSGTCFSSPASLPGEGC